MNQAEDTDKTPPAHSRLLIRVATPVLLIIAIIPSSTIIWDLLTEVVSISTTGVTMAALLIPVVLYSYFSAWQIKIKKNGRMTIILTTVILTGIMYIISNLFIFDGAQKAWIAAMLYNICFPLVIYILYCNLMSKHWFLKPYLSLSVLVALGGVLAWLFVVVAPDNMAAWALPDEILRKTAKNIGGDADARLYAMPYFIGLVLIGERPISMGGFEIFRASGISHEPAIAVFFILPSLLLAPTVLSQRRWHKRVLVYATLGLFIMVTLSVSGLLVLTFCLVLLIAHPERLKNNVYTTALIVILFLIILSLMVLFTPDIGGAISTLTSWLQQKLTGQSVQTTINLHKDIIKSQSLIGVVRAIGLYSHLILLLFTGIIGYFGTSRNRMAGLCLIAIVGMSLKDPIHRLRYPLYWYLTSICILMIFNKEKNTI